MTEPGQSAEDLFGEALELPPESRATFLDQACRDAPELRRQVEQLLVLAPRDQRPSHDGCCKGYAVLMNWRFYARRRHPDAPASQPCNR